MLSQTVRTALTEPPRLGNLNNKHLFIAVLEAGSPRAEHQHGRVLVKTYAMFYRLLSSSQKGIYNPIMTRLPPTGPICRHHSTGLEFQHVKGEGLVNMQSTTDGQAAMYLSIPLLLNIWVFLIFLNMNKMAGNTFTHSSSNSMINLLEQIPRSGSKCKVLLWTLTNCYLKKIVLIYISPLSPTERRPAHFTEPGSP